MEATENRNIADTDKPTQLLNTVQNKLKFYTVIKAGGLS